jgi:hypothetical protein
MRAKTRTKLKQELPKREKRSDPIVDVRSASELKEGVKGAGSASKPEDHLSGSLSSETYVQSSSSESKETPQALSAEEIAEEFHVDRIARGKVIVENFRKEKEIAKGSGAAPKIGEDWASLSATFDRTVSAPGAYQRIVSDEFKENLNGRSEFLSECAQKRSEAKAAMGANSKAPEDVAREPSSLKKEESLESAPSPAKTGNPDDPNEYDGMQAGGNQDATSATKSSDSDSSSASTVAPPQVQLTRIFSLINSCSLPSLES